MEAFLVISTDGGRLAPDGLAGLSRAVRAQPGVLPDFPVRVVFGSSDTAVVRFWVLAGGEVEAARIGLKVSAAAFYRRHEECGVPIAPFTVRALSTA